MVAQRTNRLRRIKHENTTLNIRKLGGGDFKFCTFTQNCNGLTGWNFEIPASAYCQTVVRHLKKTKYKEI
jgi:hypothetical protein